MYGMSLLRHLPDELGKCSNLQILEIKNSEQLVSVPSLKSMGCLQSLAINSQALISHPDDFFHGLYALRTLFIYGRKEVIRIPSSFDELTSLVTIYILQSELEDVLPLKLRAFRGLSDLCISYHSAVFLRSTLEELKHLPNLEFLGIHGFKDEQQLAEYFSDITPFLHLQSLKELLLVGCPEIRSLPEQLGLLTSITGLRIGLFEDLEEIPEWLCNLSSLELLEFRSCMSLKCLPSKEALLRLTRLRKLVIIDCPLLKECIFKDNSPEWLKVKHLNYIEIDGIEVF